jgi:hypothetical protein
MCQILHLTCWHSWMPTGEVQTTNKGNQHLIHRHDKIFPTPNMPNKYIYIYM